MGWRSALKIFAFVIFLFAANHLTHTIAEALEFELRPSNEDMVHRVIMTSAFLYAGLLAIPFVPGAEIGLALLVSLGPPIAFLVYVCTVLGLTCSFVIGKLVPAHVLVAIARTLKLKRLANFLEEIEPLDQENRLELMAGKSRGRALPIFLKYRYLCLGLLFNVPGNFLIGGGGGIGLIAGMSGLFSVLGYIVTVMIAVSPIPLVVSFFGSGFLN